MIPPNATLNINSTTESGSFDGFFLWKIVLVILFLNFAYITIPLAAFPLNLLTVLFSLSKDISTRCKPMVVLICANNMLISVMHVGPFFGFSSRFWNFKVVITAMPFTISVFQLVFTATKVYAVYWPLQFNARFTQRAYAKLAVAAFTTGYAASTIAYWTGALNPNWLTSDAGAPLSLTLDTVNMLGNLLIFAKLKQQQQQTSSDSEIRQAIRANFFQAAVPFAINFPSQLLTLTGQRQGEALFAFAVVANLFVDPLCILVCISAYRDLLRKQGLLLKVVVGISMVVPLSLAVLSLTVFFLLVLLW